METTHLTFLNEEKEFDRYIFSTHWIIVMITYRKGPLTVRDQTNEEKLDR